MPVTESGQLRDFTEEEILAMEVETFVGRGGDHGSETREVGQSTMRKQFFCRWDERFNFCALVCGDEKIWNDYDGGTLRLSRMLPDETYGRHDLFPEIIATRIDSIQGVAPGIEGEGGVVGYEKALVSVYYEHVPFDSDVSDEVIYDAGETWNEFPRFTYFDSSQGAADSISLPGGAMKFWRDPEGPTPTAHPNGVPVPYGVSISKAVERFSYIWAKLPFQAFDVLSSLYERVYGTAEGSLSWLGCINSEEIFNRAVGTVMLVGVTPTLQRSHTGAGRRWTLKYDFAYSSFGWTWLYYPDPAGTNSGWYMVSNTAFATADALGDEKSIVPGSRDLRKLFSVTAG